MQLEALSIFCDVVRHQSFSRGAVASAVSQSAASQAVRQIEKHLGTQLIDRSKRPWRLTEDGKIFFQTSQELVERYHELEDTIRRRQRPSGYTVRLASIYSVRLHDLSGYVDRFRTSVPGADVELAYMHPDQVYEQVLSDQCDLGLLSFANPGRSLTAIPWEEQAMVVACLPGHRLASPAAQSPLNPSELSGEPFRSDARLTASYGVTRLTSGSLRSSTISRTSSRPSRTGPESRSSQNRPFAARSRAGHWSRFRSGSAQMRLRLSVPSASSTAVDAD